jgi:hypothetical protein
MLKEITGVEILAVIEDGNMSDAGVSGDEELLENVPCFQPVTRIDADKLSWEDETNVPLEQDDDTRVQVDGESEGLEGVGTCNFVTEKMTEVTKGIHSFRNETRLTFSATVHHLNKVCDNHERCC